MTMQKLGPNLGELFKLCKRKFSKRTVAMIGIQILDHIKYLHSLGILHCDIKPENILINDMSSCRSEEDMIKLAQNLYIVDFGLACYWRTAGGAHIEKRVVRGVKGRCD